MPDKVDIHVFGSRAEHYSIDKDEEDRIAETVRSHILPARADIEYRRINVRIQRDADQKAKYIVAHMLRKDTWTADVVRLDVDETYGPGGLTFDYDDVEADEEDEEDPFWGGELGEYAEAFVVATPCTEFPTAVQAVNDLYDAIRAKGYSCKRLIGADASVANYKAALTSGAKGFVNIGHGSTTGIVLADGALRYSWFNGLSGRPVRPAVVYFNSCQVFNDPLKAAVLAAGARSFIGGIVNLLVGPSENVCVCFWKKALASATMQSALASCEQANYPRTGDHGIAGDLGRFRPVSAVPLARLYRYWNPTIGDHFYTTNWRELGGGAHGWRHEGVQCYVHKRPMRGTVRLHRYWNPRIGDHFYTTNWRELGGGAHGWRYEGVQCYVYPRPAPRTRPLFRYWNAGIGDHFYTTNWRELAGGAHGWRYEGIQCYVLDAPRGFDDQSAADEAAGIPEFGAGEDLPAAFEAGIGGAAESGASAPVEGSRFDGFVAGVPDTFSSEEEGASWTSTWGDQVSEIATDWAAKGREASVAEPVLTRKDGGTTITIRVDRD